MGCDITGFVEEQCAAGFWSVTEEYWQLEEILAFHGRAYLRWALVADVRNSCGIVPITDSRGLPFDVSEEGRRLYHESLRRHREWLHSTTWITLADLLGHDYDQVVDEQSGREEQSPRTVRELLHASFFENLQALAGKVADASRLRAVIWFDN